ncbi:hypothetical protein MTO96_017718 [Rhipicephalus appendiculatus]
MAYYETPESYAPYHNYYDQTATTTGPYTQSSYYDQTATATGPYTQSTYDATATAPSSVTNDENVSKSGSKAPSLVMTLCAVFFFLLIGAVTTIILLTLVIHRRQRHPDFDRHHNSSYAWYVDSSTA